MLRQPQHQITDTPTKSAMIFQKKTPFFALAASFAIFAGSNITLGQNNDRGRNNPYSPSPNSSASQDTPTVKSNPTETIAVAKVSRDMEIRRPTAQNTNEVAKISPVRSPNPVEIYKAGIGDVLFVNLKNTTNASGYYTVRANGTIDFPLAGDNVVVTDKTADEIGNSIAAAITLYANPRIEVKIREFASHKINVTGMVERSGEKCIQREAVPLFVVRAGALVDSKATKALVRRGDLTKIETYDLHDAKTDDVLIYPGNSIEFTTDSKSSVLATTGFYYIAGDVKTAGQKDFTSGLTLSKAVLASGGAKGNPKKAMIRRKGDNGTLNVAEYSLRAIKDGKAADPALSPGDMIEIGN